MPWSQLREPGRVAGDETEPTGKRDENTKRIRREYERNTKRIRRQRASNPPATRLYHTCKWLVLPGPAPFCVGIQLAGRLPQARSGRNGRRRASLVRQRVPGLFSTRSVNPSRGCVPFALPISNLMLLVQTCRGPTWQDLILGLVFRPTRSLAREFSCQPCLPLFE